MTAQKRGEAGRRVIISGIFSKGELVKRNSTWFPLDHRGILGLRQRKDLDLKSTSFYQAWVLHALNKENSLYQPFCNTRESDLLCPDTALLPGKLHLTSAGRKKTDKASCSSTKFSPWIFASTWYNIINVIQTWTFSLPYQSVSDCNRLLKYLFFSPRILKLLSTNHQEFPK